MRKIKKFKTYFCYSILAILLLITISCGRLSQTTAQEMFLKKNPTYTVVHSETGEGWDGVAYHHFDYTKPNDEKTYKEIWCFVQQDDGSWKVTGQWTPDE